MVAHPLTGAYAAGPPKTIEPVRTRGFRFFKPLILSAYLRASKDVLGATISPREYARVLTCVEALLVEIERFIVVVLRLSGVRGTAGRADMESAAYTLLTPGRDGFLDEDYGMGELDSQGAVQLVSRLVRAYVSNTEYDDGSYDDNDFQWEGLFFPFQLQTHIERRFQNGDGFYKWDFTRLALYEYEASFQKDGNNPVKIRWSDFHFDETVEHIFPQKPSGQSKTYWDEKIPVDGRSNRNDRITKALQNSLGNLLFLSRSSNAAASNDAYCIKQGRVETGKRVRYENASYSATEVAQEFRDWSAQNIAVRGIALLKFIERRWDIKLTNTPDDLKSYLPLCFGLQAQAIKEGKAGKLSARALRQNLSS
ncbi:HNH endonuclease family protein [Pseudomonas congelans]|uniref:HNH endonuclease family protein n=1 Tax=Pseudomonas congelans TaxID=200452 RepID=UPI002028A03F|nr:HNH endonuclease family protein [Pseudomonas congelans]